MTSIQIKSLELASTNIKHPAIKAFLNRYGEAHLIFAYHAALPLGLTPELLYSLWANFQVDCHDRNLGIPWIATSDLLLSNVCEEVGNSLYEMAPSVRDSLLDLLEQNIHFGLKRIREVAAFLSIHVQPQLKSENLDVRDFAQVQKWLSMAYLQPESAVKELTATLAGAFQKQSDDLLRIASIVGALGKPLADYPGLLTYAQGMAKYAQGDIEAAQKEFDKIRKSENLYNFSSEGIPLPRGVKQQIELEQRQRQKRLPLTSQILSSLMCGALTSGAFWMLQKAPPIEPIVTDSESSEEKPIAQVPSSPLDQPPNQADENPDPSLPPIASPPDQASTDELPPLSELPNRQEPSNSPLPFSATGTTDSSPSTSNVEPAQDQLNQQPSASATGTTDSSPPTSNVESAQDQLNQQPSASATRTTDSSPPTSDSDGVILDLSPSSVTEAPGEPATSDTAAIVAVEPQASSSDSSTPSILDPPPDFTSSTAQASPTKPEISNTVALEIPNTSPSTSDSDDSGNYQSENYQIENISGTITIRQAGQSSVQPAHIGMTLNAGDMLIFSVGSRLSITCSSGQRATLAPIEAYTTTVSSMCPSTRIQPPR